MLPGASTIYQGQDPNATPPLALTGPAPQPQTGPAPASAAPPVINAPGPEAYGSALQQAAAGDLPQAVPPPSPALNRLQQLQQQARTQTTEANSQSALAQTARATGGASPTLAQMLQQKGTTGQSAAKPKGKAKLAKGKKVVEAAPPRWQWTLLSTSRRAKPSRRWPRKPAATRSTMRSSRNWTTRAPTSPPRRNCVPSYTRALKSGALTKEDAAAVEHLFKDRDMTADDIVPELTQMIEQNKTEVPIKANVTPEPKPRAIKPEKKFSFAPKEEAKAPEAPSPKAEGAAAAPSQKAEKVSEEVLRNAGWTREEISAYRYGDKYARSQADAEKAAKGYLHIGGAYRAVTKEDIAAAERAAEDYKQNRLPQLLDTIKKKFAAAREAYRDNDPNMKLANVPYSDSPAVTEAEAIRLAERDFVVRQPETLRRQYALTDDAKAEAAAPKNALVVVDHTQSFIDPVVEARLKRQQDEEAEMAALSQQDDMTEIEDLIVSVNTNEPDSVEYKDSLSALIGFAKDSKTEKNARARASEYLENEFDLERA